ncbi:MAG TPA: DNA recombination protein RmuC [Bryobacteraceae bacterium]|nr:DNA recombination protein RmuC [Bryobacteraceae bacterium]
MEQFGLALILFAAFWVGCAAGYIAMRLRAQVAYEKGRNESAAEIAALRERLAGREQQFTEARQRAESAAETLQRLEIELRQETDRRTVAEARLSLLPKFEAELDARGKKIAEQQNDLTRLYVNVSELTTRLEESRRSLEEKVQTIQQWEARVTETPPTANPEAMAGHNKAFLDLAGEALAKLQESSRVDHSSLGQFIEPLKTSLDRVDARILELERERTSTFLSLQQQVESMLKGQASLQAETAHLASTLRSPASRGRWGEIQLRRVVELAGMLAHCDFVEPDVAADKNIGRPNLIVQLPNRRQIVVDSQVDLSAYLASTELADEEARIAKRREHAAHVRARVEQLSAQGYWDQFPQSPEFVIAFLPGEAFFSAALEFDPSLLEFGVERRVILATPTTLIALLRAVAWGWKQELVSANAKEIRELGKSLYNRLRTLAENFTEMQKSLGRTTAVFNRTVGSFESNVIPAARRLQELGASTGDDIVSPSPVDSTPRSLHLLAEATEVAEESKAPESPVAIPVPLPPEYAEVAAPAAL